MYYGVTLGVGMYIEFIDYVLSFYGPGEIYDIEATRDEVWNALVFRIRSAERAGVTLEGDSIDRELVRDIILDLRGRV